MSPREAHRVAVLKFGNVALVKEDTRAVWVVVNLVTVSMSGDPVSEDLLVTEFNEMAPNAGPGN